MKIVVFNGKHKLDIVPEILYFDYTDMIGMDKFNEMIEQIKTFQPDLFLEEEKNDGKSLYNSVYELFPGVRKAWWMIDAHCNLIDHVVYAKQFDYIFCAQSWFIPILQHEVVGQVFFLPLCHTQTLTEYEEMLKMGPVERDIEFSFVGNIRSIHVDRKRHLEKLLAIYPNFFARQSSYADTLGYLRRSYATFNCSLNNDLNFRVWEALACGANVITDNVDDIAAIPNLRKYLTVYNKMKPDWDEALTPLDTEGKVEFIKANHTLTHRMNQLIVMTEGGSQYA